MSVDDRLAELAASIDAHPVDTGPALMEVETMAMEQKTRRNVLLAVAAAAVVIAGLVWGPGLLDSSAGETDTAVAGSPEDPAASSASCHGDRPLEPGAQVISNDEVSLTITTQECMSRNWDQNRREDDIFGEFGALLLSAPDQVADLSETVSQDGQRSEPYITAGEFLAAGLIDVPSDIGAWLDGAASLTVLDEGTTSLAGGEASWWQVEVSDLKAQCWAGPIAPVEADEGCVLLWPSNIMPLGGVSVHTDELTARIYAIDTTFDTSAQRHRIRRPSDPEGGTVFALSFPYSDTAQENEAEWRARTDKMISTITFEPCQGSCNGTTDQTG